MLNRPLATHQRQPEDCLHNHLEVSSSEAGCISLKAIQEPPFTRPICCFTWSPLKLKLFG